MLRADSTPVNTAPHATTLMLPPARDQMLSTFHESHEMIAVGRRRHGNRAVRAQSYSDDERQK